MQIRFSHNSLQMALLPQTISFKSIERAIIQNRENTYQWSLWNLGTGGLPDRRHEENAQFQISGFCVRQSDKVPGDIITDTIMGQQELVSAYFSSFVRCYVNRGRCGVFLLLRLYKVDIGAWRIIHLHSWADPTNMIVSLHHRRLLTLQPQIQLILLY